MMYTGESPNHDFIDHLGGPKEEAAPPDHDYGRDFEVVASIKARGRRRRRDSLESRSLAPAESIY